MINSGLKPAYWADEPSGICNAAGFPLYQEVELKWSKPVRWPKQDRTPFFDTDEPFLYALIRNHGNSHDKNRIEYIGLTTKPKSRFGNHETALEIKNKRGTMDFSYAPINFISGKKSIDRIKKAMEEIEHLLIWAVPEHLLNERKYFTLPGMGKHGGQAWHIRNTGDRFSGRMPREIVFPWMLVMNGRDRTQK